MGDVILKKENGVVSTIESTSSELKNNEEVCHLCWQNCANANPCLCKKVADIEKKTIDAYDFITDGYQTFDAKGAVDTFVVSKCDNYKKVSSKKLSAEELRKIRLAIDELKVYYFGAWDLDDAHITQYELERKGLLSGIRGRRPNEATIRKIKERKESDRYSDSFSKSRTR